MSNLSVGGCVRLPGTLSPIVYFSLISFVHLSRRSGGLFFCLVLIISHLFVSLILSLLVSSLLLCSGWAGMEDFVSYAFVAPITCFFTSDLLILTCLLMSLLRMTDNDVLECSMLAHSV